MSDLAGSRSAGVCGGISHAAPEGGGRKPLPGNLAGLPWERLESSVVLLTGGTGLLGSALVRMLGAVREESGISFGLALAARDPDAALASLPAGLRGWVRCIAWEAGRPLPHMDAHWVIHAASPTSSRLFVERPVEVIDDIVSGGRAVVDFVLPRPGCRAVVLSSMEVYGSASGLLSEGDSGVLDSGRMRSSYPEAKRLVECLCMSAAREYGAKISAIRLAQCFGKGVKPNDGRVFAEFGRCALAGRDIRLATDGAKRNPYISLSDAASAVFHILLKGKAGEVYNAANEETCCSVLEMAHMVVSEFGAPGMRVFAGCDSDAAGMYPPAADFNLDCSKLRTLGWEPVGDLKQMYREMLDGWKSV